MSLVEKLKDWIPSFPVSMSTRCKCGHMEMTKVCWSENSFKKECQRIDALMDTHCKTCPVVGKSK